MIARALLPLLFPFLAACGSADPAEAPLEVFAAASLQDVVEDLGAAWEGSGGRPPRLRIGGSGALARQLLAVEVGDVFLSADERELDRLEEAGLLADRCALATNRLVVVTHAGSGLEPGAFRLEHLAGQPRVALGDPDVVPAGRYARTWLEREGLWSRVAPRVSRASDVRAALAQVQAGAAPVGIVYATDAARARGVCVLLEAPTADARYGAGLLSGAAPEGKALLEWLCASPAARERFEAHGFGPP